jgi:hypothetical protein
VAEGARLESVYTGNPQLTSIINRLAALLSPHETLSVLPLEVNLIIVCSSWAIFCSRMDAGFRGESSEQAIPESFSARV